MPSRSTVFGIYLHLGERSGFWLNLGIQTLATLWILQLVLRVLGLARPIRLIAISLTLILTTALLMAGEHAADRHLRGACRCSRCSCWCCTARRSRHWRRPRCSPSRRSRRPRTAQRLRCCSACAASAGPCVRGCARQLPLGGLVQGSLTIVAGAAMLLTANFALSGQLAWTPGGYGVPFGRMLQDGIVAQLSARSLREQNLKLCPYRDRAAADRRRLPVRATACSTRSAASRG